MKVGSYPFAWDPSFLLPYEPIMLFSKVSCVSLISRSGSFALPAVIGCTEITLLSRSSDTSSELSQRNPDWLPGGTPSIKIINPSGAIDQALGYVSLSNLLLGDLNPSGSSVGRSLALIRPCLTLFTLRANVPFFQISYNSIAITLVSAPTSYFTLAVPM